METGVPGLEQTGWDALRGQLNTLDTSLLFLALLTGATALSWAILSRQRGALLSSSLERSTRSRTWFRPAGRLPPGGWLPELLFSAVPGDSLHRSIPGGGSLCLGRAQARASLLVLAAALIRLYDLNILRCTAPALESEELPA